MHSTPEQRPAEFRLSVRVYYEDTDAAGIVYYANYLRFLERARTEWLRALGFEQARLASDHGVAFAARSLEAEYLQAARLDDLLTVVSTIAAVSGAQVTFAQRVERNGEVLFTGMMRIACIDVARMKAMPMPRALRDRLHALKRGSPT